MFFQSYVSLPEGSIYGHSMYECFSQWTPEDFLLLSLNFQRVSTSKLPFWGYTAIQIGYPKQLAFPNDLEDFLDTRLRKPPYPLHDLHPFRHVAAHQLHQALLWGQDVEALASDQTTNALVGPWPSETGDLLGCNSCNQLCVYPHNMLYVGYACVYIYIYI